MADEIKKIITIDTSNATDSLKKMAKSLDDSNQSFKSLKECKQYIDSLKASLVDLDDSSQEYSDTVKEIDSVQQKLNKVMYDTSDSAKSAENSYNALSKQMSELKKQWKSLGEGSERDAIGNQILYINNQLKDLDQSIGNNQRNVGNYEQAFVGGLEGIASSIEALGNPLATAKAGVGALGKAFKALLANPIALIIGAIVLAVKGLYEAFKSSQQATDDLKVAFSAFEPVIGAIKSAFDKVVTTISGFVKKAIPAVVDGIIWMMEAIQPALELINVDVENSVKNLKEIKEGILDRQKATEAAIQAEREFTALLTKRASVENQINELQNKFDTTSSYKEKIALQKQMKQLADSQANAEKAAIDAMIQRKKIEISNNPKDQVKLNQELNELYEKRAESQNWAQQQIQGTISLTNELESARLEKIKAQNEALEEQKKKEEEILSNAQDLLSEINKSGLDDITAKALDIYKQYQEGLKTLTDAGIDTAPLEEWYKREIKNLYDEATKDTKDVLDRLDDLNKTSLDKQLEDLKEKYEKEKELLKGNKEALLKLEEEYNANVANAKLSDVESRMTDDSELALQQFIAEKTILNEYDKQERILEIQKQALEEKKALLMEELSIEGLTAEQIEEIKRKLAETDAEQEENQRQLKENTIARNQDIVNSYSSLASSIGSLMSDITSFIQDNLKAKVEAGEMSEEEAEKEFERTKKAQIAATILTGLAGAAAAFASPGANSLFPVGWIAAAVQAATVLSNTAMQVAKIKQTKFESASSASSSAVSSSASQATSQSSSYSPSYTASLTGASETENLENAITRGTREGTQDIKVYVLESDIRDAGIKAEVRDSEATF